VRTLSNPPLTAGDHAGQAIGVHPRGLLDRVDAVPGGILGIDAVAGGVMDGRIAQAEPDQREDDPAEQVPLHRHPEVGLRVSYRSYSV
jgi:hypothetical protein